MTTTSGMRVALILALVNPFITVDTGVRDYVQAHRSPMFDRVMQAATDVGSRDVVAMGLLAVAIFSGPAGPATARCALAAVLGANLVVEGLKRAVVRVRPDGDTNRTNSSFPSGHAASAVAIAVVLSWRWPAATLFLWLLAILVCWSRIYLNRHFLTDVLASAVIGVAFGLLAVRLVDPKGRKEVAPAAPS